MTKLVSGVVIPNAHLFFPDPVLCLSSLWEPRELASSAFAEGQLLSSLSHPLKQPVVMYRVGWGRTGKPLQEEDIDGLHMVFKKLKCHSQYGR